MSIQYAGICQHCDQPAQWEWSDADGNETRRICGRCAETVSPYTHSPIWQFTNLSMGTERGR